MKKFLITILAFLYLASTTGATLYTHYCMGKVVELNLLSSEEEQCGKCGMDKSPEGDNGCCKDERSHFKVDNDHFKSDLAFNAMQLFAATLPVFLNVTPQLILTSIAVEQPRSHAPPEPCGLAIYKRNCVFRI